MIRRRALSIAVVVLTCACARARVEPARERLLPPIATEEIEAGRRAAERLSGELGVYEDERLASYVSDLGGKLAALSERAELDWTFAVIDAPAVQAFAFPGGYVAVTRGLLALAESEAELAGILGHQIAHVVAGHAREREEGAVGLLEDVRPFGSLRGEVLLPSFNAEEERAADALARRYLYAGGYDPARLAGLLAVLATIETWSSLHRDPGDRRESASLEIAVGRELRVGEEEYLQRLEGLVFGEDPRQGVLEGNRFQHAELDLALVLPADWRVRRAGPRVYAAAPDGTAALELTVVRVAPRVSPIDHAAELFTGNGIQAGTGESFRVSRFEAYRAPFRAETASGPIRGEAGILRDGEHACAILLLTTEEHYLRHRALFIGLLRSADGLREPSVVEAEPRRIELFRVSERTTLREAVSQAGGMDGEGAESLLNRLAPDRLVESGRLLKVVRRPRRSTTGTSAS